jgi:hypothetical protein
MINNRSLARLVFVASVLISVFIGTAVHAQAPYAFKSDATVDVPKGLFGRSGPSEEVKAKAKEQAFEFGWRDYITFSSTGARADLYIRHAKALRDRAAQLCNVRVSGDSFDDRTGKYWVELRGTCDVRATDAVLATLGGGGVQAAAPAGEKPLFSFAFFARRAADERVFLDKVTRERSITVETTGSESNADDSRSSGGRSSSNSSEGGAVTQRNIDQRKGTIERRDTAYKYRVEQSEGVDSAVTAVLSTAGFDVVKFSDVISNCPGGPSLDEIVTTFANPAENQAEFVPSPLRSRMIAAARHADCAVGFFAIGLLDILKAEDQGNGRVRVTVALTADIRDLRKRLPTAVASVPAVQKSALGTNRVEATNAALRLAATEGARDLVDQLRQRGLN